MPRIRVWLRKYVTSPVILLIFITAIFTLLAYRIERDQSAIKHNERQIAALADARQAGIDHRAGIDANFCAATRSALVAISGVIHEGLTEILKTPVPKDPTLRRTRQHQIDVSRELLGQIKPITCPPPPPAS